MPLENGIQFNYDNVYLYDKNGMEIGKITDIQDFEDSFNTEDCGEQIWGTCDWGEQKFVCHFDGPLRIIKKIMYGWTAKGPVRKRVLEKLWGFRR